jgi:hypothetical protein
MSKMSTQAERIMALEVRVKQLEKTADEINDKLDVLLALRDKGAGIFWLASVIFGTSIIGAVTMLLNYLRGN